MKRFFLIFCFVLIAVSAHSQAVLMEKGQSSLFVSGGIAKAEDLNGYGFTLGFTPNGKADVGFTASGFGINDRKTWNFGQFIQLYVLHPASDSAEVYFSLIESIQLNSTSSGGRTTSAVLSVGGVLEAKSRPSPKSTVVFSLGFLWVKPGNQSIESYIALPMQVTIAQHFKHTILAISPSLVAGNETTTYSISLSFSLTSSREKRFR